MRFIKNFIREDDGQDVVEYALVLGLVALGAGVGLTVLTGGIGDLTSAVNDALQNAVDTVNG
jgi:Flp pilus assembly pilin Flp